MLVAAGRANVVPRRASGKRRGDGDGDGDGERRSTCLM